MRLGMSTRRVQKVSTRSLNDIGFESSILSEHYSLLCET
jgi:hypothetical protein